jgi:hypothetical protein
VVAYGPPAWEEVRSGIPPKRRIKGGTASESASLMHFLVQVLARFAGARAGFLRRKTGVKGQGTGAGGFASEGPVSQRPHRYGYLWTCFPGSFMDTYGHFYGRGQAWPGSPILSLFSPPQRRSGRPLGIAGGPRSGKRVGSHGRQEDSAQAAISGRPGLVGRGFNPGIRPPTHSRQSISTAPAALRFPPPNPTDHQANNLPYQPRNRFRLSGRPWVNRLFVRAPKISILRCRLYPKRPAKDHATADCCAVGAPDTALRLSDINPADSLITSEQTIGTYLTAARVEVLSVSQPWLLCCRRSLQTCRIVPIGHRAGRNQ